MRARRTRLIAATPETVWRKAGDPRRLARWWPGVERVEGAGEDSFTQVLRSSRGRDVRADFRVAIAEPPHRLRWEQQVEGGPFERFVRSASISLTLEAQGDGTLVELELERRMAGMARISAPLMRRRTGALLDQALDALQRSV